MTSGYDRGVEISECPDSSLRAARSFAGQLSQSRSNLFLENAPRGDSYLLRKRTTFTFRGILRGTGNRGDIFDEKIKSGEKGPRQVCCLKKKASRRRKVPGGGGGRRRLPFLYLGRHITTTATGTIATTRPTKKMLRE